MKDFQREYITERKEPGFISRHISKVWAIAMTAIVGYMAGTQIYKPNKRFIEAAAGGFLVLLLWKFSTLAALWMLLIMYQFPFSISWGSSNEIFMAIIVMFVLIRVATGVYKVTIDPKIRLPIILMVSSYILSFLNVQPELMKLALINTVSFFMAASFMVLIVNFVDDEEKLRRTLFFLMISISLYLGFTILELTFPNRVFVPNWLYTTHRVGLVAKGLRMGGPIHDYELSAEFFTLNAFIIFFMFVRSKRLLYKAMFGALLAIDLFMMFTTITRGAFFSLMLGAGYLLFLSRKDLNIVRVTYIVGVLALVLVVIEGVVARYTATGSLFERVVQTTFERGLVPANRVGTWFPAFERGMENPLFGHGAGWDFRGGLTQGFWPHSLYLFVFNVSGFLGLGAFLFFMGKVLKSTFTGVKASIITSPMPEALMKIFHVIIIIFLFDQIKIEYLRNSMYMYYIWFLFGLVIATHNVILKNRAETERSSAVST